eukprot:g25924.t1
MGRPTPRRTRLAKEGVKVERPHSADMAGSRSVQRQVSRHLASLLTARHLNHSPERRHNDETAKHVERAAADAAEASKEDVIPRIGQTLRYKKNEAAIEAGIGARLESSGSKVLGGRPFAEPRSFPFAAASVIAGRSIASALQPRSVWPEECELQKLSETLEAGGVLDLKAWVRLATASGNRSTARGKETAQLPSILSMPEKVLAVIFLFYGANRVIRQMDLSGMGLDEAPSCLKAFQGAELKMLEASRGISLSGCQKLSNVKPLGSLMRLCAVDFSGCESLFDVSHLLSGGYDPPADPMEEMISLRPSTARGARSAPDGPATTRPSTARASFPRAPPKDPAVNTPAGSPEEEAPRPFVRCGCAGWLRKMVLFVLLYSVT